MLQMDFTKKDPLASLLFNIALEKVTRDLRVQTQDKIFYKSAQLLEYTDDLYTVIRNRKAIEESLLVTEKGSKQMGQIL